MRSGRGVEPQRRTSVQPLSPDNRAASARDDLVVGAGPPGVEPGPARLELAVLPFTPQASAERTTRIERASPEWRPGALPSELRPRSDTPGWSRTSGLCRRRTALSPLSYGRTKEPPAGIEPAPRPYKGRVLAVDTTEAKRWRRWDSNPHRPRCKRGARPVERRPRVKVRTGGVEPPQRRGNGVTARGARRCSAST